MLRAGRFVDLYAVVRQGVIAGIERYSIKNLETFYGFERAVKLDDANRSPARDGVRSGVELSRHCSEGSARRRRRLQQG